MTDKHTAGFVVTHWGGTASTFNGLTARPARERGRRPTPVQEEHRLEAGRQGSFEVILQGATDEPGVAGSQLLAQIHDFNVRQRRPNDAPLL